MKYKVNICADTIFSTYIEMTNDEAESINRVLTELNAKSRGNCGACWIDTSKTEE